MIVYFDTSAIIPLIIDEASSPLCERFWNDATQAVSSRLLYVENPPAPRWRRANGSDGYPRSSLRPLSTRSMRSLQPIASVEVTENLVRTAGQLASEQGLRCYDAVHLAAALAVADTDTVFVGGDRELLTAATRLGLAVARAG